MRLSKCLDTVIDHTWKGMPGNLSSTKLRDLGKAGLNLFRDLPLPAVVMRRHALDHNQKIFETWLNKNNFSAAPHGKTYMSPQIFEEQMRNGSWGLTVATVHQTLVCKEFGFHRILMANQLLGGPNVKAIVDILNDTPDFDFYCLVDSPAVVENLARETARHKLKKPLKVLCEVGYMGGRTGCRNDEEVTKTLEALRQARANGANIVLAGIEGYEGMLPSDMERVDSYLQSVKAAFQFVKDGDLSPVDVVPEWILTAGGTHFFDRVETFKDIVSHLDRPVRNVIRSGNYLVHDSGVYRQCHADRMSRGWEDDLLHAVELWAYVQSVPEPGLAILTVGKRDAGFDCGFPIPLQRHRGEDANGEWLDIDGKCEVTGMNDQHAYMKFPSDALEFKVGDRICLGVSHACTTIDKWKVIPVTDKDYNVVDGLLTYF